jgi:hypothetical protein
MIENQDDFSEESVSDLIDQRQIFRSLLAHAGWDQYIEFLDAQINLRKAQEESIDLIHGDNPLGSLIQLRSERFAFQLARDFPQAIIDSLTEEIEDDDTDESGS